MHCWHYLFSEQLKDQHDITSRNFINTAQWFFTRQALAGADFRRLGIKVCRARNRVVQCFHVKRNTDLWSRDGSTEKYLVGGAMSPPNRGTECSVPFQYATPYGEKGQFKGTMPPSNWATECPLPIWEGTLSGSIWWGHWVPILHPIGGAIWGNNAPIKLRHRMSSPHTSPHWGAI